MTLSNDNIELYLFRLKEGLLDAEERAAVEQALKGHPEWQAMADLYDPGLKLPAGVAMPYPEWKQLRRGTPVSIGVRVPPTGKHATGRAKIWLFAAAAACLLLFVTTIIRFATINPMPTAPAAIVAEHHTDSVTPTRIEVNDGKEPVIAAKPQTTVSQPLIAFIEEKEIAITGGDAHVPAAIADEDTCVPAAIEGGDVRISTPDTTPTTESVNKENRKVYYADNIIEWIDGSTPAQSPNREPTQRLTQVRNLAKRTTSVVAKAKATYDEHKEDIGATIEESLLSSQFLGNIIAAINEE